MCRYFSCIIKRDLTVVWSKKTVDHEKLIEEAELQDTKLKDRDFVRIEITPEDSKKISRNRADWQFRVDEDDTLPNWFVKNKKKAEEQCWIAWNESVKINLALDDESVKVTDTFLVLNDSSTAVLNDSSTAVLNDSSTAVLHDSSKAVLFGSSKAELHGSSKAELHDSSKAEIKSTFAVAIKNNILNVHPEATIARTTQVK